MSHMVLHVAFFGVVLVVLGVRMSVFREKGLVVCLRCTLVVCYRGQLFPLLCWLLLKGEGTLRVYSSLRRPCDLALDSPQLPSKGLTALLLYLDRHLRVAVKICSLLDCIAYSLSIAHSSCAQDFWHCCEHQWAQSCFQGGLFWRHRS